ncbi:MAG: HAMP domain-containing protein [Alphaproteobacteria bacterium]|nr:HAMP domain-containing protein [Alphaproteobacteria bacterium]
MTPPSPAPWWRSRSFNRRVLAALLVTSVLPMLLAVGVLHNRGRQLVEELLGENVRKTARAHAVDLDAFLDHTRDDLRGVDLTDPAALTAAVDADPSLIALMQLDGQGAVRAASQRPDTLAPWAVGSCQALLGRPMQPMTHAGEGHAHEVVVAVGAPAADGVTCAQVSFTLHQDLLSERTRSLVGGTAYIVDRDGRVVCHAFEEDEPHVDRGALLHEAARAVAAEGAPWTGVVEGAQGRAFAAFAPARTLPWGVWVEVPASRAAEPLSAWLRQVLALAGLLLVGAGGLAVVLVRRLVAPLGEIAAAARHIAQGRYGETLPVSGDDEVADLAREFNHMSEALAESYARLDERVAARTRALQAAREFSDLLLDTMQERILVIDADQRVVRANRAALETYGPDIVGCGCTEVHGDHSGAPCLTRRVLTTGTPQRAERVFDDPDGPRIHEVESYPIRGEAGRIDGVVELARDVTDLKAVQARLLHQEKMAALGTLAAGLAHEIGNPLASLSSELEMLEHDPDPAELQASLPVLRDQIRRMSGLLRELVELGRPSTDELREHDPVELLHDAARLLRHDPRARGVTVEVTVDPGLTRLCTSRDRLLQVLLNLGLNALDALGGQGRLRFSATPEGAGARLRVEDDGPGVPPEQAGRVFEPFFTTKPPGQGTGLGLFVSERIVTTLGGRIELRDGEGGGARFDVVLPRCGCPPTEIADA